MEKDVDRGCLPELKVGATSLHSGVWEAKGVSKAVGGFADRGVFDPGRDGRRLLLFW